MVKEPPPRSPIRAPTTPAATMPKKPIIQQQERQRNTSPCRGRNQHQIRHGLYQKLGLLGHPTTPPPSEVSASTSSLPSCFNRRPKGPLHATEEKPRVTFYEQVVVRNIPSHRDYDSETWDRLYVDPKVVQKEMKRNKYEFWVDDNNWRRATEEDEFFMADDGTLVHPASWSVMSNLAHQYRVTFHGSSFGNDYDDNDDECWQDSDEEEHDEEDPTSVMEVDGPPRRSSLSSSCQRNCPYKNDAYRYGHPQHGRVPYQSRYYRSHNAPPVTARRRASIYVCPVQA